MNKLYMYVYICYLMTRLIQLNIFQCSLFITHYTKLLQTCFPTQVIYNVDCFTATYTRLWVKYKLLFFFNTPVIYC